MSESDEMEMDEEMDTRDDDSFSNSPEGSSDEEDADEEKIAELQKQLDASPYTYELHVQLIALYRKSGDLDRLRVAREKMSEHFPLTPELWLDWLTDEKSLATAPEQKEKLVELFERAVKDYSSVSVWLEYVQFSIGNTGETFSPSSLEAIRQTFERAITAVGIHVTQGCLIWEAYREFENFYLMSLQAKKDSTDEEKKEQENRVYNLFKRQLSIPMLDMDKTYKEFNELFLDTDRSDAASIDFAYNKALQKMNKLQEYEENLFGSEGPHYEEYKAYIEFEKQEGEPIRVQSIFERAVVENCLKDDLWLDYTKYMDRVVKISDMSLLVYERAVRNCPWSSQLWVKYGRALERYQQPHKKITNMFETALMMGFSKEEDFRELWLGYLDFLRRKIKMDDSENSSDCKEIGDVFERAITQMEQYFWGSESQYVIAKYWIFFLAKYKKDVANARQCWKELIVSGHKEEARVWLDYVNFEKIHGDVTHYRKALLSALSSVSDWPETFVDLLLTFERQEGTLESFEKSEEKCEQEMKIVNQKRLKKMEEAYGSKKEDRRGSRGSKRQSPQSKDNRQQNTKSDSTVPIQMDSEGFKIPPPPGKFNHPSENQSSAEDKSRKRSSEESDSPEPKKKKVETNENHGVTVKHDSSKDDRSVFLSNLSYNIEEEQIREFCSPVGEIEEIRLVKDFKGRSKGYCYVVYKSELDAKKALEKDREKIDGRPVLVSPCEDRKSAPLARSKLKHQIECHIAEILQLTSQDDFIIPHPFIEKSGHSLMHKRNIYKYKKFSSGLEKQKVFVKNLHNSVSEKELEDLFKEHGKLKSVRLVTFRNGHPKGLAYVEFEDEESASNAVLKMDGAVVHDKVISVAISNPPPRKVRNEFLGGRSSYSSSRPSSSNEEETGSSSKESSSNKGGSSFSRPSSSFGPRGRGRTQLSMLPRAIARSGNKNVPNSSPSLQNGQKSDSTDSGSEAKPLSNSDFANMLKK